MAFLNQLEMFQKKCDEYISDGTLKEYFTKVCDNKNLEKYIDLFIEYCLGGKRLRAFLVKTGYELFGKESDDTILLPALSYEVFQTAILAHDDIIDKSEQRRFKPSMYVKFGGDHEGISKAIFCADIGLVCALDMIEKSDFEPQIKNKAVVHQNKIFVSTMAGELFDFELSKSKTCTLENIIEMYLMKTAPYTVAGPLVLGAIFAGQGEDIQNKLFEYGNLVGCAFQIKDDILGIFSSADTTGKSDLSDMREGKKTVLSLHFIQNATDVDKDKFDKIYGNENSNENDLEMIKNLFIKSGSLDFANNMCRAYIDKANEILGKMNVNANQKQMLLEMNEYILTRNN